MNSIGVLKQVFYFIILVLIQVLVLNHIFFLGYATPFLYIYFIIKLPVTVNRNVVILSGFLLGLVIDIFCNTLGVNAAAATCMAFLRLPIQRLFFDKEEFEHLRLSLSAAGTNFIKYVVCMVLVHHILLISIETFSYYDWLTIVLRIISSSVLTFVLICALEGFSFTTKQDKK